jgi:hypothetical protein
MQGTHSGKPVRLARTLPSRLPSRLPSGPANGPVTGPATGLVRAGMVPSSPDARRVRHDVRDGVAVVAFSAVASTALAFLLLLLVRLTG